jgi:endoglucanase
MLGGPQYASDLSSWLANAPADPLHGLAASWHIYNFSWCTTRSCWDGAAASVAQQVPLVHGELGEDDGGSAFVDSLYGQTLKTRFQR